MKYELHGIVWIPICALTSFEVCINSSHAICKSKYCECEVTQQQKMHYCCQYSVKIQYSSIKTHCLRVGYETSSMTVTSFRILTSVSQCARASTVSARQRINKKCIVVQQPLDGEQKKVAVVVLIKEKKGRTKESNDIERKKHSLQFDWKPVSVNWYEKGFLELLLALTSN